MTITRRAMTMTLKPRQEARIVEHGTIFATRTQRRHHRIRLKEKLH